MAQICETYKEKVEEKISKPISERIEKTKKNCKKKKCKKWCLCCNKWFCWLAVFYLYLVKWIVEIIVKWIPYIVCRIISIFFTLILTILNILSWPVQYLYCIIFKLEILPIRALRIEVVIIDSEKEKNDISESEIKESIRHSDRILREEARIKVELLGEIKQKTSNSLYRIDARSPGIKEWLKGLVLLLGRNSARNITVYAVKSIEGSEATHLLLYGSVFIKKGNPDTTLCHELGHCLLSIFNTYHNKNKGYLMYIPAIDRQSDCNWPTDVPRLSKNERCTMRRSRWLDYSWSLVVP